MIYYYKMGRQNQARDIKKGSRICNNRGQGTLEYVLLLVITISLVLALGVRMFTPFQGWIKIYMGTYLECLLDAGELPALGASGVVDQTCNDKFDGFSLVNGRPPKDGLGKGSSGKNNADKGDEEKGLGPGSGSGNSSGKGGAPSPSELRHRKQGSSKGSDGAGVAGREVREEGQENGSSKFYRFGAEGGYNRSKKRPVVGVSGFMAVEQEREKKKEERERRVVSATGDAGSGGGKTFHVRKPDKAELIKETDDSWSLGKIFRWAIIIMIIVAIILFLVNQARQISKGLDK